MKRFMVATLKEESTDTNVKMKLEASFDTEEEIYEFIGNDPKKEYIILLYAKK